MQAGAARAGGAGRGSGSAGFLSRERPLNCARPTLNSNAHPPCWLWRARCSMKRGASLYPVAASPRTPLPMLGMLGLDRMLSRLGPMPATAERAGLLAQPLPFPLLLFSPGRANSECLSLLLLSPDIFRWNPCCHAIGALAPGSHPPFSLLYPSVAPLETACCVPKAVCLLLLPAFFGLW